MSVRINDTNIVITHIRHDGRSYDIRSSDLNIDGDVTRETLQENIENHLDIAVGALSDYEVDVVAETGTLIFRPAARFGI